MKLINLNIKSCLIILVLILVIMFSQTIIGQVYKHKEPLAHTFSIVARDAKTGEMAVAVQSHWFSVGTLVSWGKSGVGVIATQSFVNPAYGPEGLKLMENGKSAEEALNKLINEDNGRDFRQVAFLDVNGNVLGFTGEKCIESAGNKSGENYSVQANMMLNDKVVPAMAESFEKNLELPLAERVVKVLQAAQMAGGDIRGKQSAVLLVVGPKTAKNAWQDKKIDLRVDDHAEPLLELERLLKIHRAYDHMNAGDLAAEHSDMEKALDEYGAAENMFPDNLEMKYWKAVALANNKRLSEALPIFKEVFGKDVNWKELTKRLPKSDLLHISEEEMKMIIEL